mmetsp:Transcript_120756/g.269409  ORF Transcript_120756/g.269409 Transcript_120756/m.269409 type:complete len:246 (-) Transcript_120756:168-905(-)
MTLTPEPLIRSRAAVTKLITSPCPYSSANGMLSSIFVPSELIPIILSASAAISPMLLPSPISSIISTPAASISGFCNTSCKLLPVCSEKVRSMKVIARKKVLIGQISALEIFRCKSDRTALFSVLARPCRITTHPADGASPSPAMILSATTSAVTPAISIRWMGSASTASGSSFLPTANSMPLCSISPLTTANRKVAEPLRPGLKPMSFVACACPATESPERGTTASTRSRICSQEPCVPGRSNT